MSLEKYILDANGEPVVERDLIRWAEWFERGKRRVAHTEVSPGVEVSTIFLGLDYNFAMFGPPVLWETMIFGGKLNREMWRYRSRQQAEAGHENAVRLAMEARDE